MGNKLSRIRLSRRKHKQRKQSLVRRDDGQAGDQNNDASLAASKHATDQQLSKTCLKCDEMLANLHASRQDQHHSHKDLALSAQDCHVCALLLALFKHTDKPDTYITDDEHPVGYNSFYLYKWKTWTLSFNGPRNEVGGVDLQLYPQQDGQSFMLDATRDASTHSTSIMNVAINWFNRCNATHHKCSKSSNVSPSRLLDIGSSDADDVFLRTIDIPSNVRYATLSHCWGKLKILRLLQENITALKQSIPIQSLPRTFREAIQVARLFELHYLWIDSLCIVQDDADDWRKESALMADVYGGSTLNISASGARDGSEGLFRNRDADLVQRPLVRAKGDPDVTPGIGDSTAALQVYYCMDRHLIRRNFELQPLFSRAWCVQERHLAPRTLHFGNTQIMWECHTDACLETVPEGFRDHRNLLDGAPPDFTWFRTKERGLESAWHTVVEQYSHCFLTKKSDKLIAISGIADYFTSRYGSQYLFGHWKEHVPSSLLWQSLGSRVKDTQVSPLPLLAPSWSWVSWDGKVSMYSLPSSMRTTCHLVSHELHLSRCEMDDLRSHIVDGDTTESAAQTSDEIIHARLTIKCKRLLQLTAVDDGEDLYDLEHWGYELSFQLGQPSNEFSYTLNFDEAPDHSKGSCYLLYIAEANGTEEERGLIVYAVPGLKSFFQRVGTYTVLEGDDLFLDACNRERSRMPEQDELAIYESVYPVEEDGTQMYIINLI